MKKASKLISVLLAVMMLLSVVPMNAFAKNVVPEGTNNLEQLIQNGNLAQMVERLLVDVNGAKKNITGTVLRLAFMFIKNESLQEVIGEQDVTKLSDTQNAKLLLDWLDAQLPVWTSDLTEQDWYSTVQSVVKVIGVTLDLHNVDGALATLSSACKKLSGDLVVGALAGDLKDINGNAIDGLSRSKGDLNVIYGLIQFLSDNASLLAKVVKGGIGEGGLSLSDTLNNALGSSLDDLNATIKNLPTFLKAQLYRLVDGYAEIPDLKEDPSANVGTKGEVGAGYGASVYAGYTADQLLAVALIRLINNQKAEDVITADGQISVSEANAALSLSFYDLLAQNIDKLFESYGILDMLNEKVNGIVDDLCVTTEIKALLNTNIVFTEADFAPIFKAAETEGVLPQINALLKLAVKKALKNPSVLTLDGSLNENIGKLIKFILPYMANETVSNNLGYDFTSFTAENLAGKSTNDLVVIILKLFYKDWFGKNALYNNDLVAGTTTISQLGALAAYYTLTNSEWLKLTGIDAQITKATATIANVASMSNQSCATFIMDTAAAVAYGALSYNGSKIYFTRTASASWGYVDMFKDITDWALNFAKGLPAVVNTGCLEYGKKNDPFYKLNVILNELIDFSFLTGANDATFQFDFGTVLNTLVNALANFDIESILNLVAKNNKTTNLLNNNYTVISGALSFINRALTSLFEHNCSTPVVKNVQEGVCLSKTEVTYHYCTVSGHYTAAAEETILPKLRHEFKLTEELAATCTEPATKIYVCECGQESYEETSGKPLGHSPKAGTKKVVAATCTEGGYTEAVCKTCNQTYTLTTTKALGHIDANDDGICDRENCKAVLRPVATDIEVTATKDIKADKTYVYANNGKTVADLLATSNAEKVVDAKGNQVAATAKLATGMVLTKGDKKLVIVVLGDIDGDAKITASDARLALRSSVGLEKLSTTATTAALVTKDAVAKGKATASDARMILRASVGLEKTTDLNQH